MWLWQWFRETVGPDLLRPVPRGRSRVVKGLPNILGFPSGPAIVGDGAGRGGHWLALERAMTEPVQEPAYLEWQAPDRGQFRRGEHRAGSALRACPLILLPRVCRAGESLGCERSALLEARQLRRRCGGSPTVLFR